MHYTEVSITRVFATGKVFARKYSILVKLTMYKYTTPKAVLYIYARCKMVSAGGRRQAEWCGAGGAYVELCLLFDPNMSSEVLRCQLSFRTVSLPSLSKA